MTTDASVAGRATAVPDAFVSHSSRDKALFVRPLVECLDEQGLRLWYDEYSMKPGDSLSASIDSGLIAAGAGIVVISPSFIETALASGWTQYELRGIVANSIGTQGRRVLPIWLDVAREDVLAWSPAIADLLAIDASGKGIEQVALEVLRVLAPDRIGGLARMRMLSVAREGRRVESVSASELHPSPATDRRVPGNVPLRAMLVTLAMEDCGTPATADLGEFLENLSRDLHHERELRVWEAIAAVFLSAKQAFDLDGEAKAAVYHLLLSASLGVVDAEAGGILGPSVRASVLDQFQRICMFIRTDAVIGEGGLRGYVRESSPPPSNTADEDSESEEL